MVNRLDDWLGYPDVFEIVFAPENQKRHVRAMRCCFNKVDTASNKSRFVPIIPCQRLEFLRRSWVVLLQFFGETEESHNCHGRLGHQWQIMVELATWQLSLDEPPWTSHWCKLSTVPTSVRSTQLTQNANPSCSFYHSLRNGEAKRDRRGVQPLSAKRWLIILWWYYVEREVSWLNKYG